MLWNMVRPRQSEDPASHTPDSALGLRNINGRIRADYRPGRSASIGLDIWNQHAVTELRSRWSRPVMPRHINELRGFSFQ